MNIQMAYYVKMVCIKLWIFNGVSETFIQSVASKRNHIPRKSLHYRTPMEVFLSYVTKMICLT